MIINYGERLKNLRKKHGLTQSELGEKVGLTREMVLKIEREDANLDASTLVTLSSFFNVSTDYILGKSDSTLYKNFASNVFSLEVDTSNFSKKPTLDDINAIFKLVENLGLDSDLTPDNLLNQLSNKDS